MGDIIIVATVNGLVAEVARVREAFEKHAPAAVALGVSPEGLAALLRFEGHAPDEDPFDDLPDAELAYAAHLGKFGEIDIPPPDVLEAARAARSAGLPIFGVDLTQEAYEEAFTQEVGVFALLRYGRIQRKLARKPPKAATAREFCIAWDARVGRVPGVARVETRRERAIANGVRALAQQANGTVLLFVDAAREAGVQAALRQLDGPAAHSL